MRTTTFWLILVVVAMGGLGEAAAATAKGVAYFETHIRPLLAEHCYKCHSSGSDKIKGGLVLDSQEGWMNGGDSGEALVVGKPEESLLIEAVTYGNPDLQMPPKYRLSEGDVELLRRWVEMGAPDPRTGGGVVVAGSGIDLEAGREFWAFRKPVKHPLPEVKTGGWAGTDIDRFILAGLEKSGLKPVGDADRRTLIRRVTFDLTGLPPTPEEAEAFVGDPAGEEEALARVVDRLLGSRHFGERWGRHWLDVVRYGESMGRTRNWPFPMAWRYRDYVIDAFNKDKPYDQFVREQLAGDLLPGRDDAERNEQLIATGFLALGAQDLNERDAAQFRMDVVDEQLDVTGRAFMGMTAGCARCHDHKFDPIPATDYYAMAGIFKSTDLRSGYGSRRGGNQNYFQAELLQTLAGVPSEPVVVVEKKVEERREVIRRKRIEERLEQAEADVKRLSLLARGRNSGAKGDEAGLTKAEVRMQLAEARRRVRQIQNQLGIGGGEPVTRNMAMGVSDSKAPADCRVNIRGEAQNLGETVPRGFPAVLCSDEVPQATIAEGASGRVELARWMTDPDHPLTARVMVNRMWHHLFGRGLVRTVDNFGNSGEAPSHPELLDHLALKFVAGQWSMKRMIREMVMSRTYRLSADHEEGNYGIDPENVQLWRANLRRLEVEALRDAILAVSGGLDPKPAEGSPVMRMPLAELGRRVAVGRADEARYRSVYLPVLRNLLPEMFEAFDFAEPSSVMGRRDVTTVSTQALFMMNNPFVISQSERLAEMLMERHSSDGAARVKLAFERAFSREPAPDELKQALELVRRLRDVEGRTEAGAWAAWCQVIFASAEFRYLL